MEVVVIDELAEHHLEMTAVEDQHPIQALAPDGAGEALGVGVCTRSTDWCADDPNALGMEDLIEASCELGVPVAD
jgi:hypothetical protein